MYGSRLVLTVLIAAGLSACSDNEEEIPATGTEVAAFSAVDVKVRDVMRTLKIPGASITVAKDGVILYQRGFGWADRAAGQPVQPVKTRRAQVAQVAQAVRAEFQSAQMRAAQTCTAR